MSKKIEKTVTPKEVAELIADGNVVAIAQGRSEITDHALGNRSIVADPRTIESKQILSRSKYQPDHIPCITSVLEESASDWFDMDKLKSSPEAMYAVDALDVTKEQAQGAVYTDGSTRVQTVNEGYNQNYYNLIKEFGDLSFSKFSFLFDNSLTTFLVEASQLLINSSNSLFSGLSISANSSEK